MMRRGGRLFAWVFCGVLAALMPAAAKAVPATEAARLAAADLSDAIIAMEQAERGQDRVAALTQAIRAYEAGLAAMRDGLRQAKVREATLLMQFERQSEQLSQLLGVLSQMEATPAPLLLIHPAGPLGTVRSGLMMSEVTPALAAKAARLGQDLAELRDLRAVQEGAGQVLEQGLSVVQQARIELSQAISDRAPLPGSLSDDPTAMAQLLQSADTMDAFAEGLLPLDELDDVQAMFDFEAQKGALDLPVLGTLLTSAGVPDRLGRMRPGISLATRPAAIVTAPWAGTVRYLGPLLDYGNVIILEPGPGYLVVLAGLQTVYGHIGQVVGAGDPLGMMSGASQGGAEFLVPAEDGSGARETETLYIEIRRGSDPIDPAPWFELTAGPSTTGR